MPTLTVNNCVLTYSFTDSNDHTKYILTITNVQKSGSGFLNHNSRVINLKVDNNSLVSSTAKQTPSVKDILKMVDHKGKVTDIQQRNAEADYKRMLSINENTAWNNFLNSFTSKKNAGKLRFEYTRDSVDKNATIYFTVFGTDEKITLIVPKDPNSEQPTPTTHEETKTIGIENVNDGKNYVINEEAYAKYGHIERVVDFSDVEDENQLLSLANIYVNALQFDDMSIEISAVDLHHLIGEVPSFDLLDEVRCISHPHGLNKVFPITEINIPLDDPAGVTYTMGKTNSSTMSQSTAANAAELFKRIKQTPSPSKVLDAAKLEMSNILNQRTTGYVNIVQENDISQALVISNSADWTSATKLWKFDINGLGYSDANISEHDSDVTADGRYYKIGITMDGTIVADFIKTGLLEDGLGYNYWNLGTGEFRLSQNTMFTNSDGGVDTFADYSTDLGDLKENVEQVYGKEVGSKNILRKSDDFSICDDTTKSWEDGGWETWGSDTNCSVTIADSWSTGINVARPTPDLTKAVVLSNESTSFLATSSLIKQTKIPVSSGTVYTLACYACGNGYLAFKAFGEKPAYYRTQIAHNSWKRYNFVFKVYDYYSTYESEHTQKQQEVTRLDGIQQNLKGIYESLVREKADQASIKSAKAAYKTALDNYNIAKTELDSYPSTVIKKSNSSTIDVAFINYRERNYSNSTIAVSGLTLVKGNISSDWSPSESDTSDLFPDVDLKLNQTYLMNKLTNGNRDEGVYLQNGHLYLNASCLQSKIIMDQRGNNYWDLDRGIFRSTAMLAKQTKVEEMYTEWKWAGTNAAQGILIDKNSIDFREKLGNYSNPKWIKNGSIYGTLSGIGIDCGDGYLTLRTGQFLVYPVSYKELNGGQGLSRPYHSPIPTMSAVVNINGLSYNSRKKIVFTTLVQLRFTQGLLTGVQVYNRKRNKLLGSPVKWNDKQHMYYKYDSK